MRLALWEPYPQLDGGGQRTSQLLATALRARGVDVVAAAPAEGVHLERMRAAGIACRTVAMPAPLRSFGHRTPPSAAASLPVAWARLARSWRDLRPDVVVASNLRGMLLCGPSARLAGAGTVWHVHLGEPDRWLNRVASALADHTVVPSAAAASELAGVPRRSVTVLANAVETRVLPASAAELRTADPRLVTSARLTPQKGLTTLIEAVAQLRARHPRLSATVYGGPQDGYQAHADDLCRRVAAAGIGPAVRFAGHVPDAHLHYPAGALYVQPSLQEILPVAILEAMAAGLPVVASDVGGVADAVVDGQTGLLVPPGDAAALASAIDRLVSDPSLAASLGRAGAERVRRHFGVDAMADRWLDLLGWR